MIFFPLPTAPVFVSLNNFLIFLVAFIFHYNYQFEKFHCLPEIGYKCYHRPFSFIHPSIAQNLRRLPIIVAAGLPSILVPHQQQITNKSPICCFHSNQKGLLSLGVSLGLSLGMRFCIAYGMFHGRRHQPGTTGTYSSWTGSWIQPVGRSGSSADS